MVVLAIDPGSEQSAWVEWDGKDLKGFGIVSNPVILGEVIFSSLADILVIESIESFGMPVGKTVFKTCFWSGRFCQAWGREFIQVPRREVKIHFCHTMRAKDSNIRQALIDRFGVPGTKKNSGLTYGISKDMWSAFALAVFFTDKGGSNVSGDSTQSG